MSKSGREAVPNLRSRPKKKRWQWRGKKPTDAISHNSVSETKDLEDLPERMDPPWHEDRANVELLTQKGRRKKGVRLWE
jgi:hypothetical protein